MNITFFGIKRSEAYEKRHINNVLKKHNLSFFKEHIDEENIKKAKNSDIICVFINSSINFAIYFYHIMIFIFFM